jgi:hypothetical protein
LFPIHAWTVVVEIAADGMRLILIIEPRLILEKPYTRTATELRKSPGAVRSAFLRARAELVGESHATVCV